MAASTPATTLVTSGPVPAVSAPTTPASSVHKNCTVALDDLPPPPPPAEPYEAFLASSLPGVIISPRPCSAAWCCGPSSSGGGDVDDWIQTSHSLPKVRGFLLGSPASGPWRQDSYAFTCISPPPSPWVWPGRGPAVDVTMVRGPLPTTLPTGPPGLPGPSGLPAGPPAVGPAPVPLPTTPSTVLNPPPRAFEDFFRGPRPLLSPLPHRPVWTLLLFRRRHRTLECSLKDQPQRWL